MPTLEDELEKLLRQARERAGAVTPGPVVRTFGVVEEVGDGVAVVRGLADAGLDEALAIGAVPAMAVALDRDRVGCMLLGSDEGIAAGDVVTATGGPVRVPVGDELLGRIVDPLGAPLDGGPAPAAAARVLADRPPPPIVDRERVEQPLHTGVLVVDAMIPLGRGQRQLVIGDRKTGKTALALDAVLAQRDEDVLCVWCAIGQKSSTVAEVVDAVRERGRPDRTLFVVADSDTAPGLQWLAPYAATAMAEHFRDRGRHALLVLDDLSRHAAIHRQVALLLREPPGREAYPGDVFHVHARLLERATRLSDERGGGTLTALAIAETQAGNLTAYIPTNLVSITDGQVYLEPRLFNEGHRPAVDVGLSVSRVGGQTQPPLLAGLSASLRLEYAQFAELEVFTRFGGVTDERTRRTIERGRRIRAALVQRRLDPLTLAEEAALLLALGEGLLDDVPLERVPAAIEAIRALARERLGAIGDRLAAPEDRAVVVGALRDAIGAP